MRLTLRVELLTNWARNVRIGSLRRKADRLLSGLSDVRVDACPEGLLAVLEADRIEPAPA